MTQPLSQFLIVYRRSTRDLIECRDLGTDPPSALKTRFEREKKEKDNADIEVVLLGAPSIEALRQTHSRYFEKESTGQSVQNLVASTTASSR